MDLLIYDQTFAHAMLVHAIHCNPSIVELTIPGAITIIFSWLLSGAIVRVSLNFLEELVPCLLASKDTVLV